MLIKLGVLFLLVGILAGSTQYADAENWADSSFLQRIPLTINEGQVPTTQNDFSLLINGMFPDLVGEAEAEIRIGTDSVLLPYEIQSFNDSTGELIAWVKSPSVSDGDIVYVYFDNMGALDAQDPPAVWDEYDRVWHLNEISSGAVDSTGNSAIGVESCTSSCVTTTPGQIGNALNFIQDKEHITFPTLSIAPDISVTTWVNYPVIQDGFIITKNPVNSDWALFLENGNLKWRGSDGGNGVTFLTPSINTWHQIVATQEGTTSNLYIDGVLVKTGTSAALVNGGGEISISRFDTSPNFYYNGLIDHTTVQTTILTADRVTTEFNNQNDQSTFYATGPVESIITDPVITDPVTDTKSGGGSANKHLTRPTFGLSHDTQNQLVDDAFTFNNNTFNITDNWHTPFGIQNVTLGESNSFSAKVYAQNDLMVQEFVFGIPNVGDVHKAELGIEVWYNFTGGITETKVIQKTNVIDVSTLNATGSKVKCQESDTIDNCYMTNISMVFLEPLYHDIMAIKAIDFENRYQTTYLNDGFDISGDSLNPMHQTNIAGPEKYEGPILVTQTAKYSNIWIAQDGREFERNDSGSFKHINPSHVRHADPGEPKTRLHSQFFTLQQVEEIKAKYTLAEICRRCQDIPYDKINDIIVIIPTSTHRNSDSGLEQMIIYEAIKAEYTLDKMLDIYSSNPFYKEFRK